MVAYAIRSVTMSLKLNVSLPKKVFALPQDVSKSSPKSSVSNT